MCVLDDDGETLGDCAHHGNNDSFREVPTTYRPSPPPYLSSQNSRPAYYLLRRFWKDSIEEKLSPRTFEILRTNSLSQSQKFWAPPTTSEERRKPSDNRASTFTHKNSSHPSSDDNMATRDPSPLHWNLQHLFNGMGTSNSAKTQSGKFVTTSEADSWKSLNTYQIRDLTLSVSQRAIEPLVGLSTKKPYWKQLQNTEHQAHLPCPNIIPQPRPSLPIFQHPTLSNSTKLNHGPTPSTQF